MVKRGRKQVYFKGESTETRSRGNLKVNSQVILTFALMGVAQLHAPTAHVTNYRFMSYLTTLSAVRII